MNCFHFFKIILYKCQNSWLDYLEFLNNPNFFKVDFENCPVYNSNVAINVTFYNNITFFPHICLSDVVYL